jgi:hypothetical protein
MLILDKVPIASEVLLYYEGASSKHSQASMHWFLIINFLIIDSVIGSATTDYWVIKYPSIYSK